MAAKEIKFDQDARAKLLIGVNRLADAVREFERAQIEAALAAEGGNMTRAASRLGLERSHLYKKMKQLGWQPDA